MEKTGVEKTGVEKTGGKRPSTSRLPKQLLYGETKEGERYPEDQKKINKQHVKTKFKKPHVNPDRLEALASVPNFIQIGPKL